jgi:xanthine dehydrogenase molybdopterin-binding subunit B
MCAGAMPGRAGARPHRLSGQLEVGGQEHFYLEGQIAYVLPQEQNQWLVYSSTQHPGEMQHWVAHALGWTTTAVRRMPAHGRRLRRQGDPGRPSGGVGRGGREQAASARSSCAWTATTTS